MEVVPVGVSVGDGGASWGRSLVAFLLAKKPLNSVPTGHPLVTLAHQLPSLKNLSEESEICSSYKRT